MVKRGRGGRYVSKRGVFVDVEAYLAKYGNEIAAGDANVNARGDKVGRGGKVITKVEDRAKAYYRDNPKAVKRVSIKDASAGSVSEDLDKTELSSTGDKDISKTKPTKKKTAKKAKKKKAPDEIVRFEKDKPNED